MVVFRFREDEIQDSAVADAFKELANILKNVSTDSTDVNAIHDNVSAEISAVTEKATSVDADIVLIEDSEDSNAKKKVQLVNLPSSGVSELSDLSDVNTSTPTDKFILVADGTDFESRLLLEADISNLQSYLTAEINDLSAVVTWANVPLVNVPNLPTSRITSGVFADGRIAESNVTQHEDAIIAGNSQLLDNIDSTGFARLGTTNPAQNYLYTARNDASSAFYVRQAGSGIIARLFKAASGTGASAPRFEIDNAGRPSVTGLAVPHYITTGYVSGKISVSASEPGSPAKGDIWFDTS